MDLRDLVHIGALEQLACLLRDHPGPLYLRYSRGPEHDDGNPSIDYESGLELPGLSVNPLLPECWWKRPIADWLARQICNYEHLESDGRRAWIVEGEIVARGPDNEPLLAPMRVVGTLEPEVIDEARQRYRARFDVGRDSTC